jgi:hypothetical protein
MHAIYSTMPSVIASLVPCGALSLTLHITMLLIWCLTNSLKHPPTFTPTIREEMLHPQSSSDNHYTLSCRHELHRAKALISWLYMQTLLIALCLWTLFSPHRGLLTTPYTLRLHKLPSTRSAAITLSIMFTLTTPFFPWLQNDLDISILLLLILSLCSSQWHLTHDRLPLTISR